MKKKNNNSNNSNNLIRNLLSLNTTLLSRMDLFNASSSSRNIDTECNYPTTISISDYKTMYERNGVANRVVRLFPEESWCSFPDIYESEEAEETEFEKILNKLISEKNIFHCLKRADILSGIGRYGIILLGINDGQPLDKPVVGIDEKTGNKTKDVQYELLYLKMFDESSVDISKIENDFTSPRYGYPVEYTVRFVDYATVTSNLRSQKVHWTRVIHIADNRLSSDVYGEPRMKPVYNNLLDLKKITGGSGEMFWKGGFPGISFEAMPGMEDATIDATSLRTEMDNYMNGLQRYIATTGLTAKSLQPQVADPTGHIKANIQEICITLGCPLRVFVGSEEAQLASSQDKNTWNMRLMLRRNEYISTMIIKPFMDRLILFGVLPEVDYKIYWPDLNAPTDRDKASIADLRTTALTKYVTGGVDALIPPKEYLTMIIGMNEQEAEAIIQAAEQYVPELTVTSQMPEVEQTKSGKNIQKPNLIGEGNEISAGKATIVKE